MSAVTCSWLKSTTGAEAAEDRSEAVMPDIRRRHAKTEEFMLKRKQQTNGQERFKFLTSDLETDMCFLYELFLTRVCVPCVTRGPQGTPSEIPPHVFQI